MTEGKGNLIMDIDSGHWPMVNKPVELARLLAAAAAGA